MNRFYQMSHPQAPTSTKWFPQPAKMEASGPNVAVPTIQIVVQLKRELSASEAHVNADATGNSPELPVTREYRRKRQRTVRVNEGEELRMIIVSPTLTSPTPHAGPTPAAGPAPPTSPASSIDYLSPPPFPLFQLSTVGPGPGAPLHADEAPRRTTPAALPAL